MNLEELAQLLAASRRCRGLSVAELTEKSGVDQASITRVERGLSIRLDEFVRILEALDLEVRSKRGDR